MPDSIGTDTTKKKDVLPSHESEIKKTQSTLKEGETITETKEVKPFKKASGIPKAKPIKFNEDKLKKKKENAEGYKKNELSLPPNKKAQRTKGSLAITRADYGTQRGRPLFSTDKLGHREGAGEKQKDAEKASKVKLKTIKVDSEKQASEEKKKSNPDIAELESESEELPQKESLSDVKMDEELPSPPQEPKDNLKEKDKEINTKEEIPPSNVPSSPYSTCSFFEKIQQGVKSYFSSRNSLGAKSSAEDKAQTKVTEGGIQIDGGVTEEVEEEREANVLEYENHSRIKFNESSKISERVLPKRNRLFTGGQSITFFDDRLKTKRQFRIMKFKKLYHPKKSYVRIQIPRKGYFYRSYANLKIPGSSSRLSSRLESSSFNDSESSSEVQIPGMAATSFEISSFYEKELNDEKTEDHEEEKCKEKEELNIFSKSECSESEDENYAECNFPEFKTIKEIIFSNKFETLPDFDNLKCLSDLTNQELISLETDKNANDEGDVNCKNKKNEMPLEESILSQYLIKCIHGGDYELFKGDQLSETDDETLKKSKDVKLYHRSRSPTPEILNYLNSTADFLKNTGNSINPSREKTSIFCKIESSTPIYFENESFKKSFLDITKSLDNFDCQSKIKKIDEIQSNKNISSFLMEDIDLHMEFENYLKTTQGSDGITQTAKARTRNTLQKNQTNWSRKNEVFSEENLHDDKISNFQNNNPITTNNSIHGLTLSSEFISNNTSSLNRLRKTSSMTFDKNSSYKLTTSCFSKKQQNLNKDNYLNEIKARCLSPVKKSNENVFSSSPIENPKDCLKIIDRSLCNCDNVKIAKSESDTRQINEESVTSKTFIKRSFGKTSFQSVLAKNESDSDFTLGPKSIPVSQILLTSSNQTAMAQIDNYEKIFPLTKWPIRRYRKNKYKGMSSNVLFKNLEYSLSSESFRQAIPISASDYNKSYFKGFNIRHSTASDSTVNNDQNCDMKIYSAYIKKKTGIDNKAEKDLSLQDVIDIYNNVLNENEKLRSDSYNPDNNPLFSYVKDLLKEKKLKSDFCKLPCNIDPKILQPYVTLDQKNGSGPPVNPSILVKYVNMFQAVLLSSLSINQISNLNNIISGVPNPLPENIKEEKNNEVDAVNKSKITGNKNDKNNKNNKKVKNEKSVKQKSTINTKETILMKQKSQMLAKRNIYNRNKVDTGLKKEKKIIPKSPDPKLKKKKTFSEISSITPKQTNLIKKTLQPSYQKKLKEPLKKVNEKEEKHEKPTVTNVELSSPKELDSILKTHLKSISNESPLVKKNLKPPKVAPRKLLVTVKMNGDKIMVNSVTRITSDKALDKPKQNSSQQPKEISDLIIEGIPKRQNKKISIKSGKKLQTIKSNGKMKGQFISKNTSQIINHQENKSRPHIRKKIISRPEAPKSTFKTPFSTTPAIVFKMNENSTTKNDILEHSLTEMICNQQKKKNVPKKKTKKKIDRKEKEKNKFSQTFEYHQELLKTQHPLEAIVEKSESRLVENGERTFAPDVTMQKQVFNQNNVKSVKKYFKKLERVDEILRQLFLNNPLFPKLLQSKLNTLFWELKTSKNGENKEKKYEEKTENLSDYKKKGLGKKNSKLPKTSKSVSDIPTKKSVQNINLKEMPKMVEDHVKNGKEFVEMPFNSMCENYCYVVKNLVENKKLKTKKKETQNIAHEPFAQDSKYREQREPSLEKTTPRSKSKDCEQEVQTSINKTTINKIKETESLKKKNDKKLDTLDNVLEDTLEEEKKERVKKSSAGKISVKNISNNTILYLNTEISADSCSIDFLCNDLSENLSGKGSNNLKRAYLESFQNDSSSFAIDFDPENRSHSDSKNCNESTTKRKRKKVKTIKSEINLPTEALDATKTPKKSVAKISNGSAEETVKKLKESPIFIHSAKIEHDDISFPSLMIQSESGLKNHSVFPVTKSQIKNMLKSNYDRKFFPGRISDNNEEQTPFVTFFLTPQQNKTAGLTSDQAKIITRERVSDSHKPKEIPKEKIKKEIDGGISLANIEKFIEFLSKNRKKTLRHRDSGRRNKCRMIDIKNTEKLAQQMKNIKRCRRFLESIIPNNQNHYPQCEIKKTLIKTKAEIEKERKQLKRKIMEESKKLKLQKKSQKINNLTHSKPVVQTKSLQRNSQNKFFEEEKKTYVGESKSNVKLRKEEKLNLVRSQGHSKYFDTPTMSTILESNEKELNSTVFKNSPQEQHKAKSEKNYSLKKSNKKNLTRSCELLNFVKEVISTAPDTKTKKEVIEVIEDYSKTLQKTLIEKAELTKEKALSMKKKSQEEKALTKAVSTTSIAHFNKTKKSDISTFDKKENIKDKGCKTFTIKIRCNNQNIHGNVSNQPMNRTKPEVQKNIEPALKAFPLDAKEQEKEGNIYLLDSLIDKNDSKELFRVSSVYFDAADDFSDAPVALQKKISDSELSEEKFSDNNNLQEQSFFATVVENRPEHVEIDRMHAVSLKHSDFMLFSQEPLTNEFEEKIFGKIMNYLQDNDVSYAMVLVEELLKKSKIDEQRNDNSSKMKNLLKGIENKSITVIERIEKGGWLKVLALIEEVALEFQKEKKSLISLKKETKLSEKILKTRFLMPQVSESLKNLEKQVHRSKIFMNTVKSLSESGLLLSDISRERSHYLQEMISSSNHSLKVNTTKLTNKESFCNNENTVNSNSYVRNIFSTLGKSYKELKKNYLAKKGSEQECDASNSGIKEGLQIHKTSNALEIPEGVSVIPSNADHENATFFNQLKEQIQRQRQYVHHLLNADHGNIQTEVQDIKNKVANYLASLESAIFQLEATHCIKFYSDYTSDNTRVSDDEKLKKASYCNLAQTYDTCLDEHKILQTGSDEPNLESSINYLVVEGLRSFNKSYSTSFDVGPFFNEDPH